MPVHRGLSSHVPDPRGSPVSTSCLCLRTASLDIQELVYIQSFIPSYKQLGLDFMQVFKSVSSLVHTSESMRPSNRLQVEFKVFSLWLHVPIQVLRQRSGRVGGTGTSFHRKKYPHSCYVIFRAKPKVQPNVKFLVLSPIGCICPLLNASDGIHRSSSCS